LLVFFNRQYLMAIRDIKQLLKKGIDAYKQKRYDEALGFFSDIESRNRELPENHYYLGLCYTSLQEYTKAAPFFAKVISARKNPFHVLQANMISGYIYTILNEFQKAEEHFNSLLKMNFENAQINAALGYICNKRKQYEKSEFYLKKALTLDGANANANNSLGYNYLEWGKNIEQAGRFIKKALEQDENNPAYLDSMGWWYYLLGKFNLSRKYLTRAWSFDSKNQIIKEHLDTVRKRGTK